MPSKTQAVQQAAVLVKRSVQPKAGSMSAPRAKNLLQRAQDEPLAISSADLQRLAITAGPQAVQRLVNRADVRQARHFEVSIPTFRPMAQIHTQIQMKPLDKQIDNLTAAPAGVIQAKGLMRIEEFARRKNEAANKKSFGRKHSVSDVKIHFEKYSAFVTSKKYVEARAELATLRLKIGRMRLKDYWKTEELRDALLNDLSQSVTREETWLQHEEGGAKGTEQQLGVAPTGIAPVAVPMARRIIAKLTMGQGLTVNLSQMILTSNAFSTCSPIVMFNDQTNYGGLFHFPALGNSDREENLEEQKPSLRAMFNKVMPTEIHLNHRNDASIRAMSDVEPLQSFFQDECHFAGAIRIIEGQSGSYSVTLGTDGALSVTNQPPFETRGAELSARMDRDGDQRLALQEKWANAPTTSKFGRDEWLDDGEDM